MNNPARSAGRRRPAGGQDSAARDGSDRNIYPNRQAGILKNPIKRRPDGLTPAGRFHKKTSKASPQAATTAAQRAVNWEEERIANYSDFESLFDSKSP